MGKYKAQPKYNVLSIRVSDEEKAVLEELTRRDHISISNLMREAIRSYVPHLGAIQPR
jgi:predicted transcriptional regulator